MNSDKPRIPFGWWLVMLAGLVVLVTSVPFYHSMAIWTVALERLFTWSRNQLGAALTISRVLTLLLAPVVGHLTDRFGPRRLVLSGLCMAAVGFVLFGLIQNLLTYYAASTIIVVGVELCGSIPLTVMLCRWFTRRRAVAIAIYLSIPSLIALPLIPLLAWSVDPDGFGVGWRPAAFIVAGVITLVAVIAFFKVQNNPSATGRQGEEEQELMAQARQTGFPLGQTLRSRTFWYITLGGGLVSAGLTSAETTAKVRALEMESSGFLALIVGVSSLVLVCSYLLGGMAGDRFTKHRMMALFAALQALGVLTAIFAQSPAVIALALVLMSAGAGGLVHWPWPY